MIQTTVISPEKAKFDDFPCLGQSNHPSTKGMIVLFSKFGIGIVVGESLTGQKQIYPVGHGMNWDMTSFDPCPPGTKVEIVQQ